MSLASMGAPRIVVAGATTALVRRTTGRKSFVAPWHPMVEQMWLYALADAQRVEGVAVHFSGLFVTHHHTDVTATRDNLPELTRRFHRDLSCGLHTLLCEQRYDAPRELFDDRQTHWVRLLDAPAQAARLVYDATNAVAAGLVRRPEHMPMRTLDFGLWKTGHIDVERPPLYFDKSRPAHLQLVLSPPPLLFQAFGGDLDALVHHMQRLEEQAIARLRDARSRPVLGAKNVRRLHPWSEPKTLREPGPNPLHCFRIGAAGILGQQQRIEAALEVRGFRLAHRDTRVARRDGDLTRAYPYGTYAAKLYQGAPVDDVSGDALVAQPGPTLDDVRDELAQTRVGQDGRRKTIHALTDQVREAFADEAADIVDDADLELCTPTPSESATRVDAADPDAQPERGPAVVRHRFDRRDPPPARRIVYLRDRRRGRPPGPDPPDG